MRIQTSNPQSTNFKSRNARPLVRRHSKGCYTFFSAVHPCLKIHSSCFWLTTYIKKNWCNAILTISDYILLCQHINDISFPYASMDSLYRIFENIWNKNLLLGYMLFNLFAKNVYFRMKKTQLPTCIVKTYFGFPCTFSCFLYNISASKEKSRNKWSKNCTLYFASSKELKPFIQSMMRIRWYARGLDGIIC